MVTSPNEWTILEWEEKHQTNNKQTNNHVKDNNLLGELGTFFLVSEEENACNCKVAGEILKFEYWSLVNGSFQSIHQFFTNFHKKR